MKCPSCNNEMKKGYLGCHGYNPYPSFVKNIFWYKEKSVVTGLKDKVNFGDKFEAFICTKCKKVIFGY